MEDLYREVVIDRYRHPHHRHVLDSATAQAHTYNPLCGDELTIFVRVQDQTLAEAAFDAHGCSISQASADLMIDAVQGQSLAGVRERITAFRRLLAVDDAPECAEVGEAQVLRAVRKYPVRVKCALLAWDTLETALEGSNRVGGEAPDG